MKKLIIILAFMGLGIFSFAHAATWNAGDCLQPTIQGILNNANFVSLDVLQMPTCSETWTAAVVVPAGKDITIKGNGATNTVITFAVQAFGLRTTASRITAVGFKNTATSTNAIVATGQGWRIDHCRYDRLSNVGANTFVYPGGASGIVFTSGLIDNNIINSGRITVLEETSIARMHTRWNTAIAFGNSTVGDNSAVYVEDNIFTRTSTGEGNIVDANGGQRYVVRYNTITADPPDVYYAQNLYAHGIDSGNERGTRSWEVYGNLWNTIKPISSVIWPKSGTGFIFYNSLTGYSESSMVRLEVERAASTYGDPANNTSLSGRCDGDNASDGNAIPPGTGWPCRDHIGTGKDAQLSSYNNYYAQEIQPAYVWTVLNDGTYKNVVGAPSAHVVANQSYYQTVASFNGTTGVGCGTLAARPATCTTGVGYWATTQSCSDISTMVGDINTYPTRATISGTLYKCTATDTWTAYYTPYTYPHPLTITYGGTTPSSPKGLRITGGI